METRTIPPMKPVLVTDISDDINVLQKDDVTKQRTVLTARAIEDLFKCAPIKKTSDPVELHPDNAYFVGDKIDFNKIVTSQSRFVDTGTYVHGPTDDKYLTDRDVVSGDPKWAANHVSTPAYNPRGFLYVFSVLEDESLSWDNYDGVISIKDELGNSNVETAEDVRRRRVNPRKPSERVRQIFITSSESEMDTFFTFDGTKDPSDSEKYNNRVRHATSVPMSRLGTYDSSTGTYSWTKWCSMSIPHDGPEYFTNITIDSNIPTVKNPLSDAVYHIYADVGTFELPNANLDGYRIGQKIIVEVHPSRTEGASSSCRVVYTDTLSRGEDSGREVMSVLVTPRARVNTKDVFGTVSNSNLVTSVAAFEIVETKDASGNVYRTWELDAGVEESDFTSGLAQMLGEHTDLPVSDIVHAQDPNHDTKSAIDVLYPVSACGYVKANFLLLETLTDPNWVTVVQIVEPMSDASFVKATETTPLAHLTYYIRETDRWSLAENNGHPTAFLAGNDYYSIDMTKTVVTDVIPAVGDTSVLKVDNQVHIADLTINKSRSFTAYASRGSLIRVHIASNKQMSNYRGKIYPEVSFIPDHHSEYILKAAINPYAFTTKQLYKLFVDGSVVGDIKLASCDELFEGILNAPCATRALVEAYGYLASKLQSKGLLFGNCLRTDVNASMMNSITTPGHYFIKLPTSGATASNLYPPDLVISNGNGFNMIVLGNDHAPSSMIHDEDGQSTAEDKVVQVAIVLNSGDPMAIDTRIGTKSGSTWTWTEWKRVNDWSNIVNTPKYFPTRWDMFHSPNGMVDYVDHVSNNNVNLGSTYDQVFRIDEDTVGAMLEVNPNPENASNINYDVPTLVVGIKDRKVSDVGAGKPYRYIVELWLPNAQPTPGHENTVVSSINDVDVSSKLPEHRRRKVRIMLHGNPDLMTNATSGSEITSKWKSICLHVGYGEGSDAPWSLPNAGVSKFKYDYFRTWGGDKSGYLDIEFEQADIQKPDGSWWRIWCPVEIG